MTRPRYHTHHARVPWIVVIVGAALWTGSWYLMFLEVTRWHHVEPDLAFNSDLVGPDGQPAHPGLPLLALYGMSGLAPLVTSGVAILLLRRQVRRARVHQA